MLRHISFIGLAIGIAATSPVSSQSLAFISYGCIGEKDDQCQDKFGALEGFIQYRRDCAWHKMHGNGDTNLQFAKEVCSISSGTEAYAGNRIRTSDGDTCGYGYVKLTCFLNPELLQLE